MKNGTRVEIHFAVKDLLEVRKRYPDIYNDDKILLMAFSVAAVAQPDAPVIAVYQAVRTELDRCLAAEAGDGEE